MYQKARMNYFLKQDKKQENWNLELILPARTINPGYFLHDMNIY